MTLSPRLTQERLAELLREVDALHDGLAPLTPEQKAAWLLPHLGAQEAPHDELQRFAEGDTRPRVTTEITASAGSSAVPRCPECGRQMSADGEGWFVCAHNHPAIYCEGASPPAVSGPPSVTQAQLAAALNKLGGNAEWVTWASGPFKSAEMAAMIFGAAQATQEESR